ncbi:gamma-glutamyl-gamma-aminobutyrate hydrolase family protein [Clostridium algidicarnis]|uniref:gamma-glutamyl-gamma-aminobutyrate hydrolase family protein n=1 Tax=Clostridium algidicarnis TaxID=37659 RepID=UPI001C0D4C12|nr:gamma-glutamyl-gamma-aminobutyrate hydrolase family protein [Clostridium algidicarnis]MBU3195894.1 gamma-glutamyl-gamma-aminobutyrate hydrolase family protein [Clostridium algidicarnis]MBU3208920.1 gamma-glutamyl-gamma-aminobutyrate hydrolase family protein [Clostridium algidicarnis]MBU3226567.1 gamma-glutamyl-gamma-aminobutyrate hydrolase family protein [Clostridium algidicarnis]MBU3250522.1 gamma-glutamyl-gamma-aminobutyrate hydrolase family protein [Clostridium algidicarnis]
MKRKARIGISGSIIVDEGGMFPGYERAYVNDDYIKSVIKAGGIPVIIPLIKDENDIKEQLEMVDGIIISGGHDVNPLLYGEEPSQKLGGILPKRDDFDINLINLAMEAKKPILGICRGHQLLNVVNGGSLYQDLSFIEGCYIKHNQASLSNIPTHTIKIKEGTRLREILEEETMCNSFHHLAIKEVAKGFIASAISKDGIVEAIEYEGEEFVMGVQWHPEMMSAENENMLSIFTKLVEACLNKI